MTVRHLDLWFESREAPGQTLMKPTQSPYSNVHDVPERAKIHFNNGVTKVVGPETFEGLHPSARETSRFLIERAMMDPDATVEPVD